MSSRHETSVAGAGPSAQTLAQVTDALAWPLMLLRTDGSLLHANLAAHRLLRRRQWLRLLPRGLVVPVDEARRDDFEHALEICAAGAPTQLIVWTGAGGRFSAQLSALTADRVTHPILLLAIGAQDGRNADLRAFAALHGLTEAETRVLERLALGESSAQAAAVLGVTAATVRSQAVSLRRKTGHASVVELLHTLASLPPLAAAKGE